MAGKRSDSGPIPPGEKFVRLSISGETQEKLRQAAFDARLSMAAYCRKLVTEAVNGVAVKTGAKKSK